jgi:hypothetical protein
LRAVSGDEHIRLDDPVPVDVGPHRALAVAEVREHCTPMVYAVEAGSGAIRCVEVKPK